MAEKVRIGIMGCAMIARKLARAILMSSSATLHAIASRSLEKAKAFAAANNLPDRVILYASYEALLADPQIDAVYMPLPTSLHLEWAVKAASSKKHVLLEKPAALSVADLDAILQACNSNGVQLMDGTMWMHHPRTHLMKRLLSDSSQFGSVKSVHSTFTFAANEDFIKGNIRVKPEMDALGALGDAGWYCVRGILWANSYEMPSTVTALPGYVKNEAGVLLQCGAHLRWEDGRVATFFCGFLTDMCMDLTVHASCGTLRVHDFIIPFEEKSASFVSSCGVILAGLHTGWEPRPSEHSVATELPQEVLMVREFAELVKGIRDCGKKPDQYWPSLTRKTQQVLNAVVDSIDAGLRPVTVSS